MRISDWSSDVCSSDLSLSIAGKSQRGEADIGICAGKVDDADLRCELYAIDRLICAAPADHALAQRSSAAYADVLAHGQVCMARASSNFQFVQTQAERLGKTVTVRVHADDFSSVLFLVRAGVGGGVGAARNRQGGV